MVMDDTYKIQGFDLNLKIDTIYTVTRQGNLRACTDYAYPSEGNRIDHYLKCQLSKDKYDLTRALMRGTGCIDEVVRNCTNQSLNRCSLDGRLWTYIIEGGFYAYVFNGVWSIYQTQTADCINPRKVWLDDGKHSILPTVVKEGQALAYGINPNFLTAPLPVYMLTKKIDGLRLDTPNYIIGKGESKTLAAMDYLCRRHGINEAAAVFLYDFDKVKTFQVQSDKPIEGITELWWATGSHIEN